MMMDYSRELSPVVFFAPAVSHRTPLLREIEHTHSIFFSRFRDDKHELSLGQCPGPTRTFIVHIWRLTPRILERGPIPQNGNVIVWSRSSSPDPEQYDGNRHIRI